MTTYTRHYLSEIWPDLPKKEFDELVTDIEKNGCINPVQVVGTEIIDGWQRSVSNGASEEETAE